MTETISYTPEEVAKILKITRFTVYEMIKRGDLPAYRIGRKARIEATDLDAYIQHSKSPGTVPPPQPAQPSSATPLSGNLPRGNEIILCGQDVALDILTRFIAKALPGIPCLRSYSGSSEGLLSLYHGRANAVTTHLWDSDTNSYNTPYVRRLLPGQPALIINIMYRMAGFYVAKGNPKSIRDWPDLLQPHLRLINRECGSGARVLLDEKLRSLNLDRLAIEGYHREELSHLAVASCVARGDADVAVGIEKAALQVQNVDFIPLQQERYDLVIRQEDAAKPPFKTLLSILKSPAFHSELEGMGGYQLAHTGEIMAKT